MSKGKKPDFRVFVSRQGEDNKTFYNEVGVAWKVKSDGISIKLFAAPLVRVGGLHGYGFIGLVVCVCSRT